MHGGIKLESRKSIFAIFTIVLLFGSLYSQTFSPDFTFGPSMNVARMNHQAVKLANQTILLIGGHGESFISLNSCELFLVGPDTFVSQTMMYAHDGGAVARLQDGRILIAGGAENYGVAPGYTHAEIYNPETQSYSATGSLNYARTNNSAATLNNGKVLVAGGWYNDNSGTYCELYNPDSGTFSLTGALNTPRSNPIVIPTNDGGAIVFSGIPIYGGSIIQQVEYYDHILNSFSILQDYLFSPDDPDWLPMSFESYNRQMAMQQLDNQNYIFMAYNNSTGDYYYTLFTIDPTLKTISRLNPKTELVNSQTHYFYAPVVDKNNAVVYLPAVDAGADPVKMDLFAFNLQDSTVFSPDTTFTFPSEYYLGVASFQLLDDSRILISGGHSQTGYNTNFSPINNSLLITPNYHFTGVNPAKTVSRFEIEFRNYPNPFNSTTCFEFKLKKAGDIEIDVIDIQGKTIQKIVKKYFSSGTHIFRWNANSVATGVYFCRLKSPQGMQIRKITLIK